MQTLSSTELNDHYDQHLWPLFNQVSVDHNMVEFGMTVHPNLSYFEGHFPDQPVLPGVVQVHWAGELAKQVFNLDHSDWIFKELKKSKFSNVVLPNTQLSLNIKFKPESGLVSFSYTNSEQRFSSGQFLFGESKAT